MGDSRVTHKTDPWGKRTHPARASESGLQVSAGTGRRFSGILECRSVSESLSNSQPDRRASAALPGKEGAKQSSGRQGGDQPGPACPRAVKERTETAGSSGYLLFQEPAPAGREPQSGRASGSCAERKWLLVRGTLVVSSSLSHLPPKAVRLLEPTWLSLQLLRMSARAPLL